MEARKHQSQEAKLETVPQPGQAPQPQPNQLGVWRLSLIK